MSALGHGPYCFRGDGDWLCGDGCRADEVSEIASLRADRDALLEALEPFARAAGNYDAGTSDYVFAVNLESRVSLNPNDDITITVGDIRKARTIRDRVKKQGERQ